MIVPPIRVIIGDDHGRRGPVLLPLQEVDGRHQELLFIEWIRIAGMAILEARRLQITDGRKVARGDGGEKVVDIVLMVAGVSSLADGIYGSRPRVCEIGG